MERFPLVLSALGLLLAAAPASAACPDPASFVSGDLKGWLRPDETMDQWIGTQWCGSYAEASNSTLVKDPEWRDQSSNYVIDQLNLDEAWSNWQNTANDGIGSCNPNQLYVRTVNAALLNDYIGVLRDLDPSGHPFTSAVTYDGNPVSGWTRDWVGRLSPNGYVWSCETKSKVEKVDGKDVTFTTFASNPSNDAPSNLFTSWVWLLSPMERAATLVHEATHEQVGHLPDSACDNGGSCDQGYIVANPGKPNNLNAQTADALALTHAIDTYTYEKIDPKKPLLGRDANRGERMVTNFGDGTCGYTPFLTPFERALATSTLVYKLENVFATKTPPAQWPLAAQLDAAGIPAIDDANGARWPCDAACDLADHTAPDGVNPAFEGCDERWRAANVAVNLANRQACQTANAKIGAGVTPSERAVVVASFEASLKSCVLGVDEDVEIATCEDLFGDLAVVEDVAKLWPIPKMPGYDPATSVERCEQIFCTEFAAFPFYDPGEIAAACYELDLTDPVTHCPDPCGKPDASLPDEEQFLRAMCHFSLFTGNEPPAEPPSFNPVDPDKVCSIQALQCQAAQQAEAEEEWSDVVAAWADEKSVGGCWFDANDSVGGGAYGSWGTVQTAFTLPFRDFSKLPNSGDLMADPCTGLVLACASERKIAAAILGKVAVSVKDGLPGPDPIEETRRWAEVGIYGSKDLGAAGGIRGLRALADQVRGALDGGQDVQRFGLLDAISRSPEAHVGLATLAGADVYGRLYGTDAMEGLFEPGLVSTVRAGGNAATRGQLGALEGEVASLESVRATRSSSALAEGLRGGVGDFDPATLFGLYQDLATAQTAADLDAAVNAYGAAISAR